MTELEKQQAIIIQEQAEQIRLLKEQVEYMMKKLFGPSRQKTPVGEGQLSLFADYTDSLFNREDEEEEEEIVVRRKKRQGHKQKMLEGLPAEEIHIELTEEERKCDNCHEEMDPMGKKIVREEVHYVPARLYKKVYIIYSYECKNNCHDPFDEVKPIKTASAPNPIIQRSFAGSTLLAWLMYMKFVLALPLYRQENEWKRYGLAISRRTLANWIIISSEDWLSPIYDRLHQELITKDVLHGDETPYQILIRSDGKSPESKAHMWNFRTTHQDPKPIVWYHADLTRSQAVVEEILKNYVGYLQADGYIAYKGNNDFILVGCWQHVRSKFFDVPGNGIAKDGVAYCDKMFEIERDLKDLSPEDRYKARLRRLKPVMEEFYEWLGSFHANKGKLRTAVMYALNQKEFLLNVLLDGRIQISNNICEQKIKPVVIGRKNYLFSASEAGARANAIVYTTVESAKENGLDPFKYLAYLFENLPNLDFRRYPELLEDFLPWSDQVQLHCKPDFDTYQ